MGHLGIGAGSGNRTPVICLEGSGSAIELYPRVGGETGTRTLDTLLQVLRFSKPPHYRSAISPRSFHEVRPAPVLLVPVMRGGDRGTRLMAETGPQCTDEPAVWQLVAADALGVDPVVGVVRRAPGCLTQRLGDFIYHW